MDISRDLDSGGHLSIRGVEDDGLVINADVEPRDATGQRWSATVLTQPEIGRLKAARADTDAMRDRLEAVLNLCRKYDADPSDRKYDLPITSDIRARLPAARKIIEKIDPDLIGKDFGIDEAYIGFSHTRQTPEMALGLLADQNDLAAMLAPDAPSLSADQLHPVIWQASAPLWDTGEFRMAAQAAVTSLSAHIKARVRSHLNDRELVQQVFSLDQPKTGQTRLHLPGNPGDKNWKSAQEGLHLIAQGAFAGIRNIAVHGSAQWTEHEALEHLAVLSVVARWADRTVEQTPPGT